jgi:hypothetical protein
MTMTIGGGVNFSTLVLSPAFDVFARPVTFYPLVSQFGAPGFLGRGYYWSGPIDIQTEDGAIYSDQKTALDIRDAEFAQLPQQGDRLFIDEADAGPALGEFEVVDVDTYDGGMTVLTLRKWLPPAP